MPAEIELSSVKLYGFINVIIIIIMNIIVLRI